MLSKGALLRLLVSLAAENDTDLVDEDSILSGEVCASGDRATVREAAYLVRYLRREFSYVASPEFERLVARESEAVRAMRRKLSADPVKRAAHRERFDDALAAIVSSDEVFDLLPLPHHASLEQLRALLVATQNPEG